MCPSCATTQYVDVFKELKFLVALYPKNFGI